ncbi:carbon-nitrogen hydrolase family protein [Thaumasiovibrio subtropicus]|uniref:carbon-nitrogen hydrolase family protein n=1 Tax=Thaumasiovibrio subtropicus TaxID=1891207 RepID=UPI00131B644F|nr:carbon-nitrogen hydrolase family protein [Thaumasiovibrio subtropicus]
MKRVGVIQMNSGDTLSANLAALESGMAALHQQQVDIAVTPENALLFSDQAAYQALAKQETEVFEQLSILCRRYKMGLVLGSFPTLAPRGKLHTTAVYFDSDGMEQGRYHKMHLFDVEVGDAHQHYRESDIYTAGESTTCVASPLGKLGLSICYDLRFGGLFEHLVAQGAQVVTVSAAFTAVTGEAHWQTLLQARAIEQQVWIVASAQCGEHSQGRMTWGHSMVIDPWGRIVAQLSSQPGVIWAEIDDRMLVETRSKMPVASHRQWQAVLKNSSYKEKVK